MQLCVDSLRNATWALLLFFSTAWCCDLCMLNSRGKTKGREVFHFGVQHVEFSDLFSSQHG